MHICPTTMAILTQCTSLFLNLIVLVKVPDTHYHGCCVTRSAGPLEPNQRRYPGYTIAVQGTVPSGCLTFSQTFNYIVD